MATKTKKTNAPAAAPAAPEKKPSAGKSTAKNRTAKAEPAAAPAVDFGGALLRLDTVLRVQKEIVRALSKTFPDLETAVRALKAANATLAVVRAEIKKAAKK